MKAISCSLVAIGMGWTFAEVRRFFFHPDAFYDEALDEYQHGRGISLICGVAFLFVGALLAFHAFGIGAPVFTSRFPYVVAGAEARRFLVVFCSGLTVWAVLSATSTRLVPPPLFPGPIASLLCRILRGGLFLLLSIAVLMAFPRIGDNWRADGFGILWGGLAFVAIYTGRLWNGTSIGSWPVPPVQCIERPFPFAASVLIEIGAAYFFLVL